MTQRGAADAATDKIVIVFEGDGPPTVEFIEGETEITPDDIAAALTAIIAAALNRGAAPGEMMSAMMAAARALQA